MRKVIRLVLFLVVSLAITANAQNDSFVYMDDGKFHLQCDEYFPLTCVYHLDVIKDINDEYKISPHMQYCYDAETSCWPKAYSCGSSQTEWDTQIRLHIDTIAAMGFNTIRINGLSAKSHWDSSGVDVPGFVSTKFQTQHSGNNYCFYINTEDDDVQYTLDTNTFEQHGDLLEHFLEIVEDHNNDVPDKPLRVTYLTGTGGFENYIEEYADFLEYFGNRFKDNPVLFAYEIMSEPFGLGFPKNVVGNKYEVASVFEYWYKTLKNVAPMQLITIGVNREDVFNWDPEILPIDFVNFHLYPSKKRPYESAEFQRHKAMLQWFSESFSKPWIIGETGLWANDVINLFNDTIATEQQQLDFAFGSLQYNRWYGSIGYTWWQYKEYSWEENDSIAKALTNFHGLVYREDNDQEYKDAAQAFQNFSMDSICDTCYNAPDSIYYNPEGYESQKITGTIKTSNGTPVENAFIKAKGYTSNPYKETLYHTYSDSSGDFIVYGKTNEQIFKIQVSYPGMTVVDSVKYNFAAPPTSINLIIDSLNQDSIPEPLVYNDSLIIAANDTVVWDSLKFLNERYVIIEKGGKLEITDSVYLKPLSKIVVKRGAELELDGGSLIGLCMWKGVEVWGNDEKPKDSVAQQGRVYMKNGAIIENANMGIRAVKMEPVGGTGGESSESPDTDYSGGQVFVTSGSTFKNCTYGVYLYQYDENNASYFSLARFETNDSINNSSGYPEAGVFLNEVNSVEFKGCTFINSMDSSAMDIDNRGIGIRGLESTFSVNDHDNGQGDITLSRFENLQHGIYSTYTSSNNLMTVEKSNFIKNWRGIYISAMDAGRITEDSFLIDQLYLENGGCGLYLDNCTGYWVEGNHFYSCWDTTGLGIVVNNSGTDANEIYRNTFDDLQLGISAQGQNKDPRSVYVGLQILCNDFDNCNADNFVPDAQSGYGIANYQGVDDDDPEDMAGNLFYNRGIPYNDFDDINNEADNFQYYYPDNPDPNDLDNYKSKPNDITKPTVRLYNNDIPNQWDYSDGCPSAITTGTKSSNGSMNKKELINYYQSGIDSIKTALILLIDGGNTVGLKTQVELSTPPYTMDIYNDLKLNSPFISESVLESSIEKEDVLPNALLRDIMVSNSHSAGSDLLLTKLDERETPMPNFMKAQIFEANEISNMKQQMESKIGDYYRKHNSTLNKLVTEYFTGTTHTSTVKDSLAALFQEISSRSSLYKLAFLQVDNNLYLSGLQTLADIKNEQDLTEEEEKFHENFTDYYHLVYQAGNNYQSIFELDSIFVQSLKEIEQNGKKPGSYARNILVEIGEIDYIAPIQLPSLYKSTAKQLEYENLVNSKLQKSLIVFPNPGKDYVIIHFRQDNNSTGFIEIKDMSGFTIRTMNMEISEDQITLPTIGWKPGIYIATLFLNGRFIESCKFTVIN